VTESDELEVSPFENGLRLRFHYPVMSDVAQRVRKELVVVGFMRLLRLYGGHEGVPISVAFDYAPPHYAAEYVRLCEGRELFRQSWCGIDVPGHLLDGKQLGWNDELYRVMVDQAELALGDVNGGRSQREQILRALHQAFPRWLDMGQVARALGTSSRSLRRHLSREGIRFTDLVAEAQREIAERLLRDPRRTIQQAAYEMGFSSPSAFHRAFKRWTGQAPSEFRGANRDRR
jgi:AraC-like DNA-binding protein